MWTNTSTRLTSSPISQKEVLVNDCFPQYGWDLQQANKRLATVKSKVFNCVVQIMTSIKVEESTVRCTNCGKIHNAENCLQELDIIAWGYTSHENLACPDCGGTVELEDATRLHE